jgi:antitoxin VapB
MEKAAVFKSKRSEAWDSWFDGESVTAGFMSEREQPKEQEREAF